MGRKFLLWLLALSRTLLGACWRALVATGSILKGILVGTKDSRSRKWLSGIGAPLAALGAGLAFVLGGSPDYFWLGIFFGCLSVLLLVIDWYWLSEDWQTRKKIPGYIFALFIAALFGWFVFLPAPLEIMLVSPQSDYARGTSINSILWQPNFSEIILSVTNDSDLEYRNFDAYLGSDIYFAKSSISDTINHCVVSQELGNSVAVAAITAQFTDAFGRSYTISATPNEAISTIERIRCDSLAPHSGLTIYFALVPDDNPKSPRKNPLYANFAAQYEAGNRARLKRAAQCFIQHPCHIKIVPSQLIPIQMPR